MYRVGVQGCCPRNFHIPVAAVLHFALLHCVSEGEDVAVLTLLSAVHGAEPWLNANCTLVPVVALVQVVALIYNLGFINNKNPKIDYKYVSKRVLCTDNTVARYRVI